MLQIIKKVFLCSVLETQPMAGRGGGRPAAGSERQTHHASLRLQRRVLERPAGESLRQVNTLTPPE